MSVVGVDLSTRALDLVKLHDGGRAEWARVELHGANAWERTLRVRGAVSPDDAWLHAGWWEDVHLVAVEKPFARTQGGALAKLNMVVGAVAASLPAKLRAPERCWLVPPHEYRKGLGLPGNRKPGPADVARIAGAATGPLEGWPQDALDALCVAVWASRELDRAVEAA